MNTMEKDPWWACALLGCIYLFFGEFGLMLSMAVTDKVDGAFLFIYTQACFVFCIAWWTRWKEGIKLE